ncbi:hypothetical protein F8388_014960 [Cannabis sativa]|uniref:Uncharacterized protein n=1 Tax=Cannabis sativa TaxID=3483 RepID=A0A7J6DYF4_CANSA|nr:hypothetical protein F8388_014960 [Cannabis sativa]
MGMKIEEQSPPRPFNALFKNRLFVRCNEAYILDFDESSTLYSKERIACSGKDCCKEFLAKFMANELLWSYVGVNLREIAN